MFIGVLLVTSNFCNSFIIVHHQFVIITILNKLNYSLKVRDSQLNAFQKSNWIMQRLIGSSIKQGYL